MATGIGAWATWDYPDRAQAEAAALNHCQTNSPMPARCAILVSLE